MTRVPVTRRVRTPELTADDVRALRALFAAAWDTSEEAFDDDDWDHATGGVHVLLEEDGRIVAHAAVVPREIRVADVPLRTGYVEAVAADPDRQGRGYGSVVMNEIDEIIAAEYELGALGTGRIDFYRRLGWELWRGPTSVRTPEGEVRTEDDDGAIMVLRTPRTPALDLDAGISCDWRAGDVW